MKRYFRIVILMLLFAVPVYSADVVVGIRDNMAASYPPYIIIDEKCISNSFKPNKIKL